MSFITTKFQSVALLSPDQELTSDYIDVSTLQALRVLRHCAGANTAYQFQIDWGVDGEGAPDFTITYNIADTTTGETALKVIPTAMAYARIRIKNTGLGAFTEHNTVVTGLEI